MKKMMFVLAFLMTTTLWAEAHRNYYMGPARISVQTFYNELAPYGEWINTGEYGFAWRPYLDGMEDFRPYSTGGNWIYTGLGWTWASDYPWGWATFHYGRWYFDDYLGWMWVPGYEWAPAWVTWGSYNDYWAWAPMGPNVFVNVTVNAYPPDFWWVFVPRRHFCDHNWRHHIWHHHDRPVVVNNITIIHNIYNERRGGNGHGNGSWYQGPRVNEVERHANTRVRRMEVADAERPGQAGVRNDRVAVYRPEVRRESTDARPDRFRTREEAGKEVRSTRTATSPVVRERVERTDPPRQQGTNPEPAPRSRVQGSSRTGAQEVERNSRSVPAPVNRTNMERKEVTAPTSAPRSKMESAHRSSPTPANRTKVEQTTRSDAPATIRSNSEKADRHAPERSSGESRRGNR